MEDEECLPENSPLKLYLQNLGFLDIHVIENVKPSLNTLSFNSIKQNSKWINVESVDEEVIKQVGILMSTQMLFEEDVSDIAKLLSNFKIVKNGMLKSMFQGLFGVFIIFLGLCLYWFIGNYAFFIISSFYAYKAADYLTRKHFNYVRLKKLATVLQTNFFLIKKIMKFIEENKKFMEYNNKNMRNLSSEFKDGFKFYDGFKSDFLICLNEIVIVLTKSTQNLIKKFPLYEYLENPQCYLCNSFDENIYKSIDMSKLYQIYLLVQSQFLQRLILSLIPNINLSQKDNDFLELNKMLIKTCINLLKIKNKLNKKFKFIFFNGIHSKPKVEIKLPAKKRNGDVNYALEFISNIHDASNSFQNLLLKSRILEQNLKSNVIPKNVENELVDMQNDLNTCQKNIADSFILLKKANATPDKQDVIEIKKNFEKCDEKFDKVLIGYSDLDPKIEDEIFEAYFTDGKHDKDLISSDDREFEDKVKKKLEKEYSKKVIKELKIKLIEKALSREKKEAELLRKKNIIIDEKVSENIEKENFKVHNKEDYNYNNMQCNSIFDLESKFSLSAETKLQKIKLPVENQLNCQNFESVFIDNEQPKSFTQANIINKSIVENSGESESVVAEHSQHNYQGLMDKNFWSNFNLARERVLKVSNPVEEEFYYDSDADSDNEEFDKN